MSRAIGIGGAIAALAFAAGCGGVGDAQQRLRSAVDAKQSELDRCYTAALARDEHIQGELEATMHVDRAEGRVDEVEFTGGDVAEPALEGCFSDVLTRVELEEPPGADLRVGYTFQLAPRD